MKYVLSLFLLATSLLFSALKPVFGQETPWIIWDFRAVPHAHHEVIVNLTATLAPGWHIYSQHLAAGGPPPTRITYAESPAYVPSGDAMESGDQTRFYSDIFEMDIVWFSGTVTFSQKLKLNEPVTTVQGTIDYLMCHDTICVPAKREFRLAVKSLPPRP